MNITEYTQLKAFARQDGFFLGVLWCLTFACFVYSIETPELSLMYLVGIMTTPLLLYYRLKNYRNVAEGSVSYLRSFAFLLVTTSCASLILTVGVYAYFRYLDDGRFMTLMTESLSSPEVRKSFADGGMDLNVLDTQLSALAQSRPIDMAIAMLSNTLMGSAFLDAIIALFGRKKTSR